MTDSPRSSRHSQDYEAATLYSVDSQHQHPLSVLHHHQEQQQPVGSDAVNESAVSSLTPIISAHTTSTAIISSDWHSSTQTLPPNPSSPGVLNLTLSSLASGPRKRLITHSSIDTPAIIVHSAHSSPEEESLEIISPLREDLSVEDFTRHHHKKDHCQADVSHSGSDSRDSSNTAREISSPQIFNGHQTDIYQKHINETDFKNINTNIDEKDAPVVFEISEQKTVSAKPYIGYRSGSGFREGGNECGIVTINESHAGIHNADVETQIKPANQTPYFQSYDAQEKMSHFRNVVRTSGKSNSLDEGVLLEPKATDSLLLEDEFSSSQSHQQSQRVRLNTMDGGTPSPPRYPKHGNGRSLPSSNLVPACVKMSKSYTDLSNHQRIRCHHDSCPHDGGPCAYEQRSHESPGGRDQQRYLGSSGPHSVHNKSSSNLDRAGDSSRYSKNHLLPEARSLLGARSMRSVSENDVRVHSATDDYAWKDGKIQLKNGGMSHCESVRYVWKDGHVEKITTDANNEDMQIEILETPDNKTCSKINPIFICIFLIAVIAVVIILPVYFAT